MPLTYKDVRKIALSLENVAEGTCYGTPAFKVDDITDHYLKYPWVLIRLSRVHSDSLPDLLSRARRLAYVKPRRASERRRVGRSRRDME
jgi:hypothetical protein